MNELEGLCAQVSRLEARVQALQLEAQGILEYADQVYAVALLCAARIYGTQPDPGLHPRTVAGRLAKLNRAPSRGPGAKASNTKESL